MSREAAARFEKLASQSVARKQIFSAALSGGSTPRRLYELLASQDFHIPWEYVHFFQVDERCVPPDDQESNYRMVREALLDRAPIPQKNFHRLPAERPDREEATRQYAKELAQVLGPKEGDWPHLDFILLGMGADGHTASLFPGSPALDEQAAWVRAVFVEKLGMNRLTLTLPVLNAAAQILFLVSGEEKAETLHQVLEGPPQPHQFPAQRVRPLSEQVSWYVDEAAARLLPRAVRKVT